MAREKISANAERRADTRAVVCAESSPMSVWICCGKGGRALPAQRGNVIYRAEAYAEIRAVICAELLAEKMAPMQKSLQIIIQLPVPRLANCGVLPHWDYKCIILLQHLIFEVHNSANAELFAVSRAEIGSDADIVAMQQMMQSVCRNPCR